MNYLAIGHPANEWHSHLELVSGSLICLPSKPAVLALAILQAGQGSGE